MADTVVLADVDTILLFDVDTIYLSIDEAARVVQHGSGGAQRVYTGELVPSVVAARRNDDDEVIAMVALLL